MQQRNKRSYLPSFKSICMDIFNFFQRLHHHFPNDEEVKIIKGTGLFDNASEMQFKKILESIRLVKYPANKIIFNEGDLADNLYIILDGSVRVFTFDAQNKKIPLARLFKGNYFGEQALLGQGTKTRNAAIEAVNDVKLIQISAKIVIPFWEENQALKLKLQKTMCASILYF